VRNLYEEAEMPLEQVMAKYAEHGPLAKLHESAAAAGLSSPCIRSKQVRNITEVANKRHNSIAAKELLSVCH
jgi:hypothetical protein